MFVNAEFRPSLAPKKIYIVTVPEYYHCEYKLPIKIPHLARSSFSVVSSFWLSDSWQGLVAAVDF